MKRKTFIENLREQFQKIAFIKKSIESGMTLEQAIESYKKTN